WLQWMTTIHMDEVVATGMFDQASLYRLQDAVDEEGITYVAQYTTDSMQRYHTYINDFAPIMREKGFSLFGDQFIAFRSVLEKIA
ncbi:MAG TPA: DUF4286 family protein, partial [Chitinophagaceae bacterium]|nr:DUF4286 family protein [Chitinophagaceae bacterium]